MSIRNSDADRIDALNAEHRYRNFFRTSLDAAFITSKDGRGIDFNDAAVELFGYESRQQLAEVDIRDLYANPADQDAHIETIERQGFTKAYPVDLQKKDGSVIHALITSVAIEDDTGRVVGFQGTIRDVTERRQANKTLERERNLVDAIVHTSPICITVLDRHGQITFANDRAEEVLGLSKDRITDRTYNHPAWQITDWQGAPFPDAELPFQRVVATGEPVQDVEHTIEWPNGRRVLLSISGAPIEDADGNIERVVFAIEDVTEARATERALRESEEKYRSLVEQSHDGIYVLYDGRFEFVNQRFEEMFGVTQQEVRAPDFSFITLVAPQSRPRIRARQERLAGGEEVKPRYEFTALDSEGREIEVEVSVSYIPYRGSVATQGFVRDITERKHAQAQLQAIDWLLEDSGEPQEQVTWTYEPHYGDVTTLNTERLILDSVGAETLETMVADIMTLLETSVAVYERNGDYAYGAFVSSWCQFLDAASRRLCKTDDNREALASGDWLCHKSCWQDSGKPAIESGEPTDIACAGGIHMYAVPIRAGGEIIGVINLGYGNPPTDRDTIAELAADYDVDPDTLIERARAYQKRPPFIATVAKRRLHAVARLIGEIVERRQAEKALHESEAFLRQVIDTSPSCIFVKDWDGRYLLVNDAIARLYDTPKDEMMGKTDPELAGVERLRPEEAEQYVADDRAVITSGKPKLIPEESFTLADGTTRWFQTVKVPLESGFGQNCVLGMAADITERKQMEEELRQQERLAAVGQLAGGIAHDFNNLLASIILYAQMPLRQPDLSSSTRDALETILDESHRAANLVQQILDFSRRAMLDIEPVDLVTLVHQAVTLLRRTLPEHIRITTEMQSPSCTIKADATRIHQMLMNLALNARDAMPKGGELHIQVKRVAVTEHDTGPLPEMPNGSWACMTVSDTGTGMIEETQDRLFEPFFTTKHRSQGTGLGLAQVYGIVKQHEGFIGVDTAVGEGTTFTICLPLAENVEEREETPDRDRRPSHGEGETILVIEDSEPLCRAIKSGLESLDYHIVTAINGYEALEMSLESVDLVLTDMVMPKMDGDVLLKELRRQAPQLKVIAMTGHVLDIDAEDLKADGFTNAILKPFSIQDLTAVVRDALDDNAHRP